MNEVIFFMLLGVASVSGGIFSSLMPAVREFSNELSSNNQRKPYQSDQNANSMDSYVQAYRISHELQQMYEERTSEQVNLENGRPVRSERVRRSAMPDPAPARKLRKINGTSSSTTAKPKITTPKILPHHGRMLVSPPRDILKFELSDAKIPDDATLKFHKARNLRQPFEIADNVNVTSHHKKREIHKRDSPLPKDQSVSESRKVSILSPLSGKSKRAPKTQDYKDLPLGVQKAIDLAIIDAKHKKKQGGLQANDELIKFFYGDKLIKTSANYKPIKAAKAANEDAQSFWAPISNPAKNFKPQVNPQDSFIISPQFLATKNTYIPAKQIKVPNRSSNFMNKDKPKTSPAPKITVQPSIAISYDGKDFEDVKFQEQSVEIKTPFDSVEHSVAPTIPTYTSHSTLPLLSATKFKDDKRPRSYATFKTPKPHHNYHNEIVDEDKLNKQLTALIGQTPSNQLKGLTDLLHQEQGRMNGNPKESTSPILFHPPQLLPEQIPQPSYTVVYENGKEYEFASYPEHPKASSQFVNVPKYEYNHQPQYIKTHTPITEHHIEGYESYKSIPQSQPEGKLHHLGKHPYPLNDDGYEFGYRVRDFHTGNDFGHTQAKESDGVTRGEYHILLPDGRVQNVKYHADDDGFHADVSYESIH